MASEIETVRAFLAERAAAANPDASIEEMRANYDAVGAAMPAADGVRVSEVELGGVRGLTFAPVEASPSTVLYFHGGGYVIGSPKGHQGVTSHLAAAANATVHSMDYRMGPEHPFPAAVEDGLAAYRSLIDQGVAPERIVIAGDSAGGGLTVATALKIREAGLAPPAGLVPISPWVNLENAGTSYETKKDADPMVTKDALDMMAETYVQAGNRADPFASPLNADLSGLAPMLIQVGSDEILLSDSERLAEKAHMAGVDVTLEVWPEMIHVFHFFHGFLSDARQAIDGVGAFVKARTA